MAEGGSFKKKGGIFKRKTTTFEEHSVAAQALTHLCTRYKVP